MTKSSATSLQGRPGYGLPPVTEQKTDQITAPKIKI